MKIYLVGDSISIHYGPYLQQYLHGLMDYSRKEGEDEALLDLDTPQGANGGDSAMVRAFLEAKASKNGIDADLLLLNCGLHDIKRAPDTNALQVPIEQYRENLRAIVKLVARKGLKLVWIRTTPCDEAVHNRGRENSYKRFSADCERYNQAADEIMTETNTPMIDLHTFTLNLGPELYCDHVHSPPHIREKQAAFIAGWLAAAVASNIAFLQLI
jgi:lysophospholipase L1-like esterase